MLMWVGTCGECMEETCNVGHDTVFIWVGRVAEIFNFEELRDMGVFRGDLEGEASNAMSVALSICGHEKTKKKRKAMRYQASHSSWDRVDECAPNGQTRRQLEEVKERKI